MNNLKLNTAVIISVISLLLGSVLLFDKLSTKKIAYVRSTELVYNYLGMQEAQRTFREKSEKWKANMDTLQNDYRRSLSRYTAQAGALPGKEREEQESYLRQQQENLMNYSRAVNDNARQEDDKITQAVLNQINSFVEEYGKEHGYDIILGTTNSGSLLYGKETIDITEEVLAALNRNYKGETIQHEN